VGEDSARILSFQRASILQFIQDPGTPFSKEQTKPWKEGNGNCFFGLREKNDELVNKYWASEGGS